MAKTLKKSLTRLKRQVRVRKKVKGTSERPRLSVFKSAKHIYAQIIDDTSGQTLLAASTRTIDLIPQSNYTGNKGAAALVGESIAKLAIEKNISRVVFDRNGFLYHGRVQALADASRKAGLEF